MRVLLRKITDDHHELVLVRRDGSREEVELATRSYLLHDMLHFAVESEAKLQGGFWGTLARGKMLGDMNDRSGRGLEGVAKDLPWIEKVVGALTSAAKGVPASRLMQGLGVYAEASETSWPAWLDEAFILAVQDRLRRLMGEWRATPYGGSMELAWLETEPHG
jgi:hypothetical protein